MRPHVRTKGLVHLPTGCRHEPDLPPAVPHGARWQQCALHLSGEHDISVHGFVALDNLTMGPESMKEFIFGCAHSAEHFNSERTFASDNPQV